MDPEAARPGAEAASGGAGAVTADEGSGSAGVAAGGSAAGAAVLALRSFAAPGSSVDAMAGSLAATSLGFTAGVVAGTAPEELPASFPDDVASSLWDDRSKGSEANGFEATLGVAGARATTTNDVSMWTPGYTCRNPPPPRVSYVFLA